MKGLWSFKKSYIWSDWFWKNESRKRFEKWEDKLSKINERTFEVLKMKEHIEQKKLNVLHMGQLILKEQIEQYKWKVFGAFKYKLFELFCVLIIRNLAMWNVLYSFCKSIFDFAVMNCIKFFLQNGQ